MSDSSLLPFNRTPLETALAQLSAGDRTLANVLRQTPNGVRVEGHTDDMPIATAQYPSNWELSAARAASVVHLFADHGVQPQRLAMMGYGQFRPRESNALPEGRNRNRRVMVIILADSADSAEALADGADTTAANRAPETNSATPAPAIGTARPAATEGVH